MPLANSEKNLVVSFFFCLLLSCGTLQSQQLSQTPGGPGTKRVGAEQRGEARPLRHAMLLQAPSRAGSGHCPPPPREFNAVVPHLPPGVWESAKGSPERTGSREGGGPFRRPAQAPPAPDATLHPPGNSAGGTLCTKHTPCTCRLGGVAARAPQAGNAAEAWGPRRSWSPAPGAAGR